MASFAYTATSSPIHRGVFIARSVLGRVLRPPPEAVAPLAPDLHPDLTTRQRVALQTQPESCQSCHGMINPLGFTLEHFDALGRYRKEEKGKPIDATGSYETRSGEPVKFSGVRDLAAFLAASERSALRLRPAVVPLPGQAADPCVRSPGTARPAAILRGTRFQYPQADGRDHGLVGFDAPRGEAVESSESTALSIPWTSRLAFQPASIDDPPAGTSIRFA